MNRGSGPNRPGSERSGHDRTVVPALASLVPLTAPTVDERARMRERILAGLAETEPAAASAAKAGTATTTTVVTDPVITPPDRVRPSRHRAASGRVARASRGPRGRRGTGGPGTSRGGERDDLPARPLSGARARFAIAAVAVLALVGSLAGMSLLLARDALPGDALYGFKRTAEAASLGLTFGDESKALKHLDFASARVSEIETLARQYPDGTSAPIGSYLSALTDFDNDAAAGSRQLIALATRADGSQLELLATWSKQQSARLAEVALPATIRGREAATIDLLGKIAARAQGLLARMDCYQITSGSFDDVGALPATGVCERVAGSAPGTNPQDPGSPGGTDSPVSPTDQPPESPAPGEPTQPLPGLPNVGSILPGEPTDDPGTDPTTPGAGSESPTVVLPLPLPTIEVPPLLPGLPGIRIGQ